MTLTTYGTVEWHKTPSKVFDNLFELSTGFYDRLNIHHFVIQNSYDCLYLDSS